MKRLIRSLLRLPFISAKADVFQTFTLTWSGAPFGNGACASAVVTFNMTKLAADLAAHGGSIHFSSNPIRFNRLVAFMTIKVTGASSGNGTFTQSQYAGLIYTPGSGKGSRTFTSTTGYQVRLEELVFFSNGGPAPTGGGSWQMTSNNGFGQAMQAVPPSPSPPRRFWALAASRA